MSSEERLRLPERPSLTHLRKQAKRLARAEGLQLADAQRELARRYGMADWTALVRHVEAQDTAAAGSPLARAAAAGDVAAVRALLAGGADPDGADGERDTPLFLVCGSAAAADARIEIAQALIAAGAFVRARCRDGATPLHAAARRGPAAMVELLLQNGALVWQGDAEGKRAREYAARGRGSDRRRILELCDEGPRIADPRFREAVVAIQSGDVAALGRILDAHPELLHVRAIERVAGPRGYFSDPKLFWFVANNPTLVPQSPPNIVDVARAMIARGVEQEDLEYAIELVMTNAMMVPELQLALVAELRAAGARVSPGAIVSTLGHRQTAPVAWLLDHGLAPTATAAAGLGRIELLARLLAAASPEEVTDALGMAVINEEHGAARMCLEAGADPNRFLACHSHSTPLHQAALTGDIAMMELLVAHGARRDILDTLWRGTPLGWALHGGQDAAAAWLRALG